MSTLPQPGPSLKQIHYATQTFRTELSTAQSSHRSTNVAWLRLVLHSVKNYVTNVPGKAVGQAVDPTQFTSPDVPEKVEVLSHGIEVSTDVILLWITTQTGTGMSRDLLKSLGRPLHAFLNKFLSILSHPPSSPVSQFMQALQILGGTINLVMVIQNILSVNRVAREIEVIGEETVQWEFEYLDHLHDARRTCESCAAALIEFFSDANSDPSDVQFHIFLNTQFTTLSSHLSEYIDQVMRAKFAVETIKNKALSTSDPRKAFTRDILAMSDDLLAFNEHDEAAIVRSVSVDRAALTSDFTLSATEIDQIQESLKRSEDSMNEINDHQAHFMEIVTALNDFISTYEIQARQAISIISEKNRIIAEQQAQIKALESIVVRQESIRSTMRSTMGF